MTGRAAPRRFVSLSEVSLSDFVQLLEEGRPWLNPATTDAWLLHRLFGASSLVAVQGSQPVAVSVAALEHGLTPPRLYIDQVAVSPRSRGAGLARELLARCETLAARAGAATAWMTAAPDNPAVACWVHLGYEPDVSIQEACGWPVQLHYKGVGKHRVVLRKVL